MKIITIKVGILKTNCYVIIDTTTKTALVVDPGDESDKIIPHLKNLQVSYIVLTHGHWDHCGAVEEIKKITGAVILIHAGDQPFFRAERTLHDGDCLQCGKLNFKVLHTPGHSHGGICLYSPGYLFSGDTLFMGTCGRTDLPGSSEKAMAESLACLAQLPPETQVFPGHGRPTSIQQEKETGILG